MPEFYEHFKILFFSDPINIFHGVHKSDNEPIRLSYQRNSHYNSIVDPHKATIGVGLGLPSFSPGAADKSLMNDAIRQSEELHLEQVSIYLLFSRIAIMTNLSFYFYKVNAIKKIKEKGKQKESLLENRIKRKLQHKMKVK